MVESCGLFLGALILVGGSLGDLFGRRALLVPGSLAIISSSFDENSRGQAIGTWSGFTAITTAIGPVLGGWLVEHASWRWVFFINLPLAAVVIAISVWRIPESPSATAGRIDWFGALVATAGLGGLIVGFIESVNLGWRNPLVFGSLIVGFGCLAAFVFIEASVTSPMLLLVLFESRSFSGANRVAGPDRSRSQHHSKYHSINRGTICIWISNCHANLRWLGAGECCRRMADEKR